MTRQTLGVLVLASVLLMPQLHADLTVVRSPNGAVTKGTPLFAFPEPLSDQPEAKAHWSLFRVAPERLAGPVPLILVHGLKSGNWNEFVDWASYSQESAGLRSTFQVWEFSHPTYGVNAAVGFSRAYPAFDESIAAYLGRFLDHAIAEGVETDGTRHFFPEQGPIAMVAHSFGGIRTLAFLRNFPEYASRVQAVVTLSGTLLGTPGATPEWMRHTVSRLALAPSPTLDSLLQGSLADFGLFMFMDARKQCDLDGGWANTDARGGFGIPVRTFCAWSWTFGSKAVTLSPRDANQTDARTLPGFADNTFEPAQLPPTYCGGLDEILPTERGDSEVAKFFVYGAYMDRPRDWTNLTANASKALMAPGDVALQQSLLLFSNALMGLTASEGSDAPLGAYALNDGLVPLQSQLMLDGTQTEFPYATQVVNGRRLPVLPYEPDMDMLRAHTLANPDRIRIFKNWTHLDTLTGRYNPKTRRSALFASVAEDLLSVIPGSR